MGSPSPYALNLIDRLARGTLQEIPKFSSEAASGQFSLFPATAGFGSCNIVRALSKL